MEILNIFSSRLRGLLRREAVLQDIEEEMRIHVEMATAANLEKGMAPAEARRAALRKFGNLASLREKAYEVRGGGLLDTFVQDVRYGARVLARNKAFTAVAVLTLALGIGANTAIFSVVNELLLRPLPYRDAQRIVMLWEVTPEGRHQNTTSPANFRQWRGQSAAFESVAAFTDQRLNLTGDGAEPEEVSVQFATPELFQVLGVKPILGRTMTQEESVPGGPKAAVLGNEFWHQRFGGDPRLIGKPIQLNSVPYTVVGILPPGFQWHIRTTSGSGRPAKIWTGLPLAAEGPARAAGSSRRWRA